MTKMESKIQIIDSALTINYQNHHVLKYISLCLSISGSSFVNQETSLLGMVACASSPSTQEIGSLGPPWSI